MRLLAGARWALAALLLLTLVPARAGLFDDDEARSRIEQLRSETAQRHAENTKRQDSLSSGQLELANQIEQLKAEIAKLRGQLEVQANDAEAAKKRQTDFYNDLDTRLRTLETAPVAEEKTAATTATPAAPDPNSETRDYEAALDLFKSARYRDAQTAFENYIKTYPNSGVLPGAYYWAAAASLQMHDYGRASELFGKLYQTWPADAKAPDAMLGQANCQERLGDARGMRKVLTALIARYPNSSAAQAAKTRLKKK